MERFLVSLANRHDRATFRVGRFGNTRGEAVFFAHYVGTSGFGFGPDRESADSAIRALAQNAKLTVLAIEPFPVGECDDPTSCEYLGPSRVDCIVMEEEGRRAIEAQEEANRAAEIAHHEGTREVEPEIDRLRPVGFNRPTRWTHRGEHVDGVWYRNFPTLKGALADLAKSLGRDHDDGEPLRQDRRYIDDNGGTHRVGPALAPSRTMHALERAYGARECGTATRAQIALLARHGQ